MLFSILYSLKRKEAVLVHENADLVEQIFGEIEKEKGDKLKKFEFLVNDDFLPKIFIKFFKNFDFLFCIIKIILIHVFDLILDLDLEFIGGVPLFHIGVDNLKITFHLLLIPQNLIEDLTHPVQTVPEHACRKQHDKRDHQILKRVLSSQVSEPNGGLNRDCEVIGVQILYIPNAF